MQEAHLRTVIWQSLDVEEIIALCQTNKTFKLLCDDPSTWQHLLKRDFGIVSTSEEAKKEYFGKVLHNIAKEFNFIGTKEEAVAMGKSPTHDGRKLTSTIKSNYFQDAIWNKEVALSALGIDIDESNFKNILGHIIGTKFADTITDLIDDIKKKTGNDVSPVEALAILGNPNNPLRKLAL